MAVGLALSATAPAQETSQPVPRLSPVARPAGVAARESSDASRISQTPKPKLPGATLGQRLPTDRNQPVTNPNNVVGEAQSPECPYLTQTLNELMAYARVNYVNLYRLALTQRRAGASQEVVRQSLAENLCLVEGLGSE